MLVPTFYETEQNGTTKYDGTGKPIEIDLIPHGPLLAKYFDNITYEQYHEIIRNWPSKNPVEILRNIENHFSPEDYIYRLGPDSFRHWADFHLYYFREI